MAAACLLAACGGGSTEAPEDPGTPLGGAASAPDAPQIVRHDFGMVRHGASVTADLPVAVVPGRALVPVGFSGDCSCARGQLVIRAADGTERFPSGRVVPEFAVRDGESLLLRLTLDTSRREPVDQPLAESKGQLVLQDLASMHVDRVYVGVLFTFGVDSPVDVLPAATLNFGSLAVSQNARLTLRLRQSLAGTPVAFGQPTCTESRIHCVLRQDPESSDSLIEARFETDGTEGAFQGLIEVPTDLEGYVLRIPVAGDVQPDLVALPAPILSLGNLDFGAPWDDERFLTVTDRNPNREPEFRVVSVTDQDGADASEFFIATLRPVIGDSRRQHLAVTYAGGYAKREFRGTIRVQSGASDDLGNLDITLLAFHAK